MNKLKASSLKLNQSGMAIERLVLIVFAVTMLAGVAGLVLNFAFKEKNTQRAEVSMQNEERVVQKMNRAIYVLEDYYNKFSYYPVSTTDFYNHFELLKKEESSTEDSLGIKYNYVCESGFCIGCLDTQMASDQNRYYKYVTGWDVLKMGNVPMQKKLLRNCPRSQSCNTNDSGYCVVL